MQVYIICQLHVLSLIYKTSPTIRWLNMMIEEEAKNCHVLTTSLLSWGPWWKEEKNADNENTHGPVTACIAIN